MSGKQNTETTLTWSTEEVWRKDSVLTVKATEKLGTSSTGQLLWGLATAHQTHKCGGPRVTGTRESERKVGSGASHALPRLPCAQETGQGNVSSCADFIPPWRRRSGRGSRPNASEGEEREHAPTSLRKQEETLSWMEANRVIYSGRSLQIRLPRWDLKSGCFHLAADPLRGGRVQRRNGFTRWWKT